MPKGIGYKKSGYGPTSPDHRVLSKDIKVDSKPAASLNQVKKMKAGGGVRRVSRG